MTWLDNLPGQRLAVAGVEQSPRSNIWNLIGVSAVYNTATRMWDITVSGGGGSAHAITSAGGAALTARPTLNFASPLAATDNSGANRTDVSLGVVPIAKGGTGLSSLGSALQGIRVNAGGTGLEYYTPSGGGSGGGAGFPFTFFASTTDGDPTAGGVRLNHATPASATSLFIDDLEAAEGTNVRDLVASLGNVIGAQVRLQSLSAPQNWIVYKVGGYTSASGYGKLTGLTVVDSSATVTFSTTPGDTIISFDTGMPKDLGNQAVTGIKALAYNGEVNNGNSGAGTKNIDWTAGQLQRITATGNATLTFTAPTAPMALQLKITQDGTGGRVFTFPTILGDPPPITTTLSQTTIVALYYDGGSYWWNYAQVYNVDVAATAAIAGTKIAPDFGNQQVKVSGASGSFFASGNSAWYGWGELPGAGVGSHRSMASTGDLRLPRNGWLAYGRNENDDGDIPLIQYYSDVGGAPRLIFGDSSGLSTGYIYLRGSNTGELRAGTNVTASWNTSAFRILINALTWDTTIPTAPVISQADNIANSGVGRAFTVHAQNATGTTSTGGALVLASGTGTTVAGVWQGCFGSFVGIEIAKPSSGTVLALCRGSALTSTQMPANTGSGVAYLADETTAPTAKPVSGTILHSSATLGTMGYGAGGVESTIAPKGSSTTRLRKLVGIEKQGDLTTDGTTGADQVIVSLSPSDINGAALPNSGTVWVKVCVVARRVSGSSYSYGAEFRALVYFTSGGFQTPIAVETPVLLSGNPASDPIFNITSSGGAVRAVITPTTSDALICFAVISLAGDTDT